MIVGEAGTAILEPAPRRRQIMLVVIPAADKPHRMDKQE
jgi:hypothetical protein